MENKKIAQKYFNPIMELAENEEFFTSIYKAIDILKEARRKNKQIFIFGNGGGAGTHFVADLFKIGEIKAICLNDNIPLLTAYTNDNGWENVYLEQLKRMMNEGDVVIVQSVHGGKGRDKAGEWSQNLTKAVDYANKMGKTISIVGFNGGVLKNISDVCIHIPINSTPIVESLQNFVHHIIAFELSSGERE
jgi:D-sedoheptulose 7-phosphate isomerase